METAEANSNLSKSALRPRSSISSSQHLSHLERLIGSIVRVVVSSAYGGSMSCVSVRQRKTEKKMKVTDTQNSEQSFELLADGIFVWCSVESMNSLMMGPN